MSNLRISFTNAAPVSMGMRIVGIQGPPGTGGGGVTDGDKGGIIVTGSGAVWTVKDGTITDLMLSSSAIALFAAASHTHIIANITGLQAALDGKAAASHTHVAADVTDFAATTRATTLTGYAAAGSRTALAAADTILGAFGKVGKWLADLAAIAFSGSASDLSAGTVPAARMPAHTGDATSSAGSVALTLATVNSNVGSFGLAGSVAQFVVNAKGLITSAVNVAISIASTAISDSTATGRAMLTAATVAAQTALLDVFTSGAKGLTPASGGGTTNFLRADGTWAAPGGGASIGPALMQLANDFTTVGAITDWNYGTSGTGATHTQVASPDGSGIGWVQGSTGTATTGRAQIWSNNAPLMRLDAGPARWQSRHQLPVLSDGTDTYTFRAGFIDSITGDSVDGAYFRYTHSVAGGNWQAVTRSSSAETATDTGVAVAAATNYRLDVRSDGAGTVTFYIDGALVATHSTNVPSGSGRETSYGMVIIKSAGTTARVHNTDYAVVEQSFSGR